jgi:hypothetical protein
MVKRGRATVISDKPFIVRLKKTVDKSALNRPSPVRSKGSRSQQPPDAAIKELPGETGEAGYINEEHRNNVAELEAMLLADSDLSDDEGGSLDEFL